MSLTQCKNALRETGVLYLYTEFARRCWRPHNVNGALPAHRLAEWLTLGWMR